MSREPPSHHKRTYFIYLLPVFFYIIKSIGDCLQAVYCLRSVSYTIRFSSPILHYIIKTAPSNDSDDWCLLIIPPSTWDNTNRRRTGSVFPSPKIPRTGEKCSLGTALKKTGVKVSGVAVTLKQWWRDVGLCPKPPPRATVNTTTKHRCRRARSMGHSFSMCKLQHCRHKKSKLAFSISVYDMCIP